MIAPAPRPTAQVAERLKEIASTIGREVADVGLLADVGRLALRGDLDDADILAVRALLETISARLSDIGDTIEQMTEVA